MDYKTGVQVEVKLSAQLVNVRTGASLWAGSVTRSSEVSSRDVNSVVVAMSHTVQASIDELVAGMEKQLPDTAALAAANSATAAPGTSRVENMFEFAPQARNVIAQQAAEGGVLGKV